MMISTPVAASIARMLRPSRPMMRPFISSLGSGITATVRSVTNSPASRSIAIDTIRLARRSASSRASSSMTRICLAASVRACAGHLFDQRALGFFASEIRDLLEFGARLIDQFLMLASLSVMFFSRVRMLWSRRLRFGFAALECLEPFFESFLACFDFGFEGGQFLAAFAHFTFGFGPRADQNIFGLDLRFL